MAALTAQGRASAREVSEAVFDTSVWIAIFNDEPAVAGLDAVRNLRMVTTPIVLAELTALALLGRVRGEQPAEAVERRARLEPLTRDDAVEGAETYARLRAAGRKISLADALIHATARRAGATLVTLDGDLRDEPGVLVAAAPRRKP